jgi:HAD superfamily hydrolase (TIGR01509 family)
VPANAVLIDLGNTLIFQAHAPDKQQLFGRMASQLTPVLESLHLVGSLDIEALLRDLFAALEPAQEERRARSLEVDAPFVTRGALATYGVDVSEEQAIAFWRATAVDLELWGWQLYPDSIDTLRRLRALAIPVALVSNGRYTADVRRPLLARFGLTEDLIDAFVFSSDVMRPKPQPEPFEQALRLLAVEPADAVLVGDDLAADIRGAKALGMTTVWKLNGRHDPPAAAEADYQIHDLCELFGLGLFDAGVAASLRTESLMPHDDDNQDRY